MHTAAWRWRQSGKQSAARSRPFHATYNSENIECLCAQTNCCKYIFFSGYTWSVLYQPLAWDSSHPHPSPRHLAYIMFTRYMFIDLELWVVWNGVWQPAVHRCCRHQPCTCSTQRQSLNRTQSSSWQLSWLVTISIKPWSRSRISRRNTLTVMSRLEVTCCSVVT